MSSNNQANEAERAMEAEAGNVPGDVPEDEDIDDPGHWIWRRGRLIRDRDGSWGQSRTDRLRRVWYPSV